LISGNDKHVLCAENDQEREDWFKILSMHIEMMTPVDDFTKSRKSDKVSFLFCLFYLICALSHALRSFPQTPESTLKRSNTKELHDRHPSNEDSVEANTETKGDNGRVEQRRDQKQDVKPKTEQGKGLGSVFKKATGL